VCVRCALKNSFRQAANMVAQVTNRWCAPSEAARFQEARRSRIVKKVLREEKDVSKLIAYIEALSTPVGGASSSSSSSGNGNGSHRGDGTAPAEADAEAGAGAGVRMDVTEGGRQDHLQGTGAGAGAGPAMGLINAMLSESVSAAMRPAHDGAAADFLTQAQAEGLGLGQGQGMGQQGVVTEEEEIRKQQLEATKAELREAFDRLTRAKAEEEDCVRQCALEDERREEATEWMLAMQGVLWPENAADCELGRPIVSDPPADSAIVELVAAQLSTAATDVQKLGEHDVLVNGKKRMFVFYAPIPTVAANGAGAARPVAAASPLASSSADSAGGAPPASPSAGAAYSHAHARGKDLLPYGMRNALDAAVMLGIAEITDVDTIVEAFRWMAWCFYCLHVLRIPPSTHTLRNLLKCARAFKLADDKVIRSVNGVLARAYAWKAKARKLLQSQTAVHGQRRIDTGKLHAVIAEVATVPLTSVLKDALMQVWDALLAGATPGAAEEVARAAAEAAAMAAAATSKRGPKAAITPSIPGIAPYALLTLDPGSLSDDEADDVEGPSTAANPAAWTSKDVILTTLPPHSWAAPPSSLWPPALSVVRYLPRAPSPVTAAANAAALSQQQQQQQLQQQQLQQLQQQQQQGPGQV
jgi:hypothetical protein